MITPEQRVYLETHAYVPEHLPAYVTAITAVEPFLMDDMVVYVDRERLIFVGYPLQTVFDEDRMAETFEQARARFKPTVISVTAPAAPAGLSGGQESSPDSYYRLALSTLSVSQKLRNMLKRAGREVVVDKNKTFGRAHKRLIKEFLRAHRLPQATQLIFKNIPAYLKSESAWLFTARNRRGQLVAFDVADFGPKHYAFYMFNFYSRRHYVPGASDLLLAEIIAQARETGKKYINLGLGINPGVTFFKTKWGGVPFLPHISYIHEPTRTEIWADIFDSLR
jgi:hypothetical protein